jgi:hypothetical protein
MQEQYITKLAIDAQYPSAKPSGVGARFIASGRFMDMGPMGAINRPTAKRSHEVAFHRPLTKYDGSPDFGQQDANFVVS